MKKDYPASASETPHAEGEEAATEPDLAELLKEVARLRAAISIRDASHEALVDMHGEMCVRLGEVTTELDALRQCARTPSHTGETIVEVFARAGVSLIREDKDASGQLYNSGRPRKRELDPQFSEDAPALSAGHAQVSERRTMDKDALSLIADKLRDEARRAGCYAAVIALSHEHPVGHSSFAISSLGRCLELEGLAARIRWWSERIWDHAIDPQAMRYRDVTVNKEGVTITRPHAEGTTGRASSDGSDTPLGGGGGCDPFVRITRF